MLLHNAEPMTSKPKTKVVFICIGNMCRSPMAEGFAREMGSDVFDVYSAGLLPTGVVSEDAILIMQEKGVDISHQRSNGFDAVPMDEVDIAVDMSGRSAERAFPDSFSGAVVVWEVDDPIGRGLGTFRRVRDEIETRIRTFLDEVRNGITPSG